VRGRSVCVDRRDAPGSGPGLLPRHQAPVLLTSAAAAALVRGRSGRRAGSASPRLGRTSGRTLVRVIMAFP
jgi:hypothetical protein